MGVSGLHSYVCSQPRLGHPFLWPPSSETGASTDNDPSHTLVVDGNGLAYHLYFKNASWVTGGQYRLFREMVKEFLLTLRGHGCKIHVVMDGVSPSSKWKERLSRARQRAGWGAETMKLIGRGSTPLQSLDHGNMQILPPWALVTFMQTVRSLAENGISLTVAEGEADGQIADLARKLGAVVVANDSDFYVYDIPGGYVPLNSLQIDQSTLSGRVYRANDLAAHLKIDPGMLALYASLCGTDYVDDDITNTFHSRIVQKIGTMKSGSWRASVAIASFLANEKQVSEAVQKAVDMLPAKEQSRAKEMWVVSVAHFTADADQATHLADTMGVVLVDFPGAGMLVPSPQAAGVYPLYTSPSAHPPPYPDLYRRGLFHQRAMELMARGLFFCDPYLDEPTRMSAWEATRNLRQNMAGLCLGPDTPFHVYERTGSHVVRKVEQTTKQRFSLDEIPTLSVDQRIGLLAQWLDLEGESSSWVGWGSDPSLPKMEMALPCLALRVLIRYSDTPLKRTEAIALANAVFCIECTSNQTELNIPKPHHVHLIGQWQLTLFVVGLANQLLLLPFPDIDPCVLLDGPSMHHFLIKASTNRGTNGMPFCGCRDDGEKVAHFSNILQVVIGGLDPYLAPEDPKVGKKAKNSGKKKGAVGKGEGGQMSKANMFEFLADFE